MVVFVVNQRKMFASFAMEKNRCQVSGQAYGMAQPEH